MKHDMIDYNLLILYSLGEDGYDADSDKRRSAGQILWIRGADEITNSGYFSTFTL